MLTSLSHTVAFPSHNMPCQLYNEIVGLQACHNDCDLSHFNGKIQCSLMKPVSVNGATMSRTMVL
jgi:hypothetical protein